MITQFSSFVHLSSQLNKVSTVAIQKIGSLRSYYGDAEDNVDLKKKLFVFYLRISDTPINMK